jgi:hypothetical protein
MFDGKQFGEDMVAIVRSYVDRVTAPLVAENAALAKRIEELEKRPLPTAPTSSDAIFVEIAASKQFEARVAEISGPVVLEAVSALPTPKDGEDGKSVDPETVREMVAEAVAAIPAPKDGKDAESYAPDPEEVKAMLAEIAEPILKAIPVVQDGKSVSADDVRPMIEGLVKEAVDAIPFPKDGQPGKDGADGAGIADLIIDRTGSLIATFTDGRMKALGTVVGKDGEPGERGADGFSLDDFDVEAGEDGRTVNMVFQKGERRQVYELVFPVMIYRDVFKEGEEYSAGDAVTWGGSVWVAQRGTSAKPDGPDSGWKLAVKRGRDGKDVAK